MVLETAGLNATELSAYCRERGLYPEQVERWRHASQDANEKPVLTLKEQKELERLRAQDQKEIKRLKQELRRKEKALTCAGVPPHSGGERLDGGCLYCHPRRPYHPERPTVSV